MPAAEAEEKALPRPKDWTESVVAKDRSLLLKEFRARGIIVQDAAQWSPSQYTSLLRLREAEALGAFGLLRGKLGTLKGMAVERKIKGYKKLYLTEPGYQNFIFYRSQDARTYFETKQAEAKYVFKTRSISGKRLFTDKGLLTQEGIEVYNRIERKLPVFWRYPNGYVTGTVRPPKDLTRLARRKPLPPAKKKMGKSPRPPASGAAGRIAALIRSGYLEISVAEERYLLSATKMTEEELARDTSLQIIPTKEKTFYLLSPSDPMMALVTRYRSGGPGVHPPSSKSPKK